MDQVVECLPDECKTLSSKKKKRCKIREEKNPWSHVWWCMPTTVLALERLRQGDPEFEANLVSINAFKTNEGWRPASERASVKL
jgi:hypothetical protein